jgi:hypothetical protein
MVMFSTRFTVRILADDGRTAIGCTELRIRLFSTYYTGSRPRDQLTGTGV